MPESLAPPPVADPVDVILLVYNRLEYLERMVDALERHTVWPHRITIVDNASGPSTRQWLRTNAGRFHQIVWNPRNEHLAGHQRGIEATSSELFVVSDADLVPHPPGPGGCWLTRLVDLARRHDDFGLIATRIDSESIRTASFDRAPVVDGEIIEAATGVWLNLMRRRALRVPYMSDGITCYALRRAGYRVGIAREVFCTHLGDEDPGRHPDYLARKQSATSLGVVYPDYPEVREIPRPPTLAELALAAPVLDALEEHDVEPGRAVELSRRPWPPVAAVEPALESLVRGPGPAASSWLSDGMSPLAVAGADAVVLARPDPELLDEALERAGSWVFLLTPDPAPRLAPGWSIVDERAGVHPVLSRLAAHGSRRRWRGAVGYSTLEHRSRWSAVFRSACFGDDGLRLYVLRRSRPLPPAPARWLTPTGEPMPAAGSGDVRPGRAPHWRMPLTRSNPAAAWATRAARLVRAEWHLWRARRDASGR